MIINVKSIQKGNLGEISVCPFQPFLCLSFPLWCPPSPPVVCLIQFWFPLSTHFLTKIQKCTHLYSTFFIMQWHQLNNSVCLSACLSASLCLCLSMSSVFSLDEAQAGLQLTM